MCQILQEIKLQSTNQVTYYQQLSRNAWLEINTPCVFYMRDDDLTPKTAQTTIYFNYPTTLFYIGLSGAINQLHVVFAQIYMHFLNKEN